MIYCEDPRRFSSRVIGFSFQGPRGRTFLPSGSRCLVSLAFAVKDFVKLSFHRGCFELFIPRFSRRKTLGFEGPKRVAVSSLCRLCCQRLCETFFPRPPGSDFCRALRSWWSALRRRGSESGGGVCPRSGPLGKYFCRGRSLSEKVRDFAGFRSKTTRLLSSDLLAGRGLIR